MKPRDLLPYEDRSGDSGVRAYQAGPNFIIVEFKSGGAYRYDHTQPAGSTPPPAPPPTHGDGLATYINQNVRDDYAEKLW